MIEQLTVWVADYAVFGLLALGPIFWLTGRRLLAGRVVASVLLTWLVGWGLKQSIYFPRPFTSGGGPPLVGHFSASSFPSNHTAVAWAVAVTVWLGGKRWLGGLLLVLAASIGLVRVVGGVHYPLDVLAAVAIGSFLAWVVDHLTPYHSK